MSIFGIFSGRFFGNAEAEQIAAEQIACVGFIECFKESLEPFVKPTERSKEMQMFNEFLLDPALSQALVIIQLIVMCVLTRQKITKTVARIWKTCGNASIFGTRKTKVAEKSNLQEELNRLRSVLSDIDKEVRQGIEKRDIKVNNICTELHTLKLENGINTQVTKSSTNDRTKISNSPASETGKSIPRIRAPTPSSATTTFRNTGRETSLPKTVTRIPLFKDSPKPISQSKIRRCSGSPVAITLKGLKRYEDGWRSGCPTRIPLFQNSPRPINVAH